VCLKGKMVDEFQIHIEMVYNRNEKEVSEMKKIIISLVIGLLIGALVVFFIFHETTPQKIESAEKNSFYEVTSKLNLGGNLYFYLSTEQIIKKIEEFAQKMRGIIESQAVKIQARGVNPLQVFDIVFRLFKNNGLMDISGVGLSSIAIEKGLNHSRFVVHHYPDRGEGLIWNLMETRPHEQAELNMLPANTVMAGFTDLKLHYLWKWIKDEAEASDIPELKKGILSLEPMLKSQGIELEKLLDALSGRVGIVFCLDNEKKSRIPMGTVTADIPNPDFALVFSVEDSYLFDLIKKMVPASPDQVEKDEKKIVIPVPALPIPLKPVIWQVENRLFVASNESMVESMMSAEKGGDRLVSSDQFKELSAYMPDKGNSFRFISSRLFQLFMDIRQKAVQAAKTSDEQDRMVREILDLFPKDLSLFEVTQNNRDGLILTVNHKLGFEFIALLPATAVVGMVAAVAIPNLLSAKQKGEQNETVSNLKMISTAIQMYIIDNERPPQGNTLEEIKAKLEPLYIKSLPMKDGWGNDFVYKFVEKSGQFDYYVGSAGRDGIFEGFEQNGLYDATRSHDFARDIIMKNGQIVFGPRFQ
jgi:type II secretory pathway pseudopilin PulG